jgi:D-beta-D-heptose 7-phosphate kinase / D-beta-D-heptose 1-phosphate adenosyltransferase
VTRLVVVGDALLDRDLEGVVERLCPEAPVPVLDQTAFLARPGGAGLAALLAAADRCDVVLVTALAGDPGGRELAALLEDEGVRVVDLGLDGATPEKVRLRAEGRLLLRVDRGGAPGRVRTYPSRLRAELDGADAVLVADYGRGVAAHPEVQAALAHAASERPLVWDPHPRGPAPVAQAALATPNRAEARRFAAGADDAELARSLLERWRARAVAVTLGGHGALVAEGRAGTTLVPCQPARGGDPCGAGDRFAVAAAGALAVGLPVLAAVERAVDAAAAFVAAGGAGALARRPPRAAEPDGEAVVARVRAAGGTVVATGGCFDLLHAGHVRMLEEARLLGDCLVVLLNSDASVRRLKGPGRPLVPEEDRAAVLGALASVDWVILFDETTPEAALAELRPDVWVKGGDYAPEELPEKAVVEAAGGRVAILPYVAGRSTTRLIEEAALRAAG